MLSMSGLAFLSCAPSEPNELEALGTVELKIKDLSVHAWIADENDERLKGLMFVTAEQLAPMADGRERGMLFIFQRDQQTGFWMKNTIINLDIAYLRGDGTVVQTFTMAALDERAYVPRSPYRFALELRAGTLAKYGIGAGDRISLPESVLKRSHGSSD